MQKQRLCFYFYDKFRPFSVCCISIFLTLWQGPSLTWIFPYSVWLYSWSNLRVKIMETKEILEISWLLYIVKSSTSYFWVTFKTSRFYAKRTLTVHSQIKTGGGVHRCYPSVDCAHSHNCMHCLSQSGKMQQMFLCFKCCILNKELFAFSWEWKSKRKYTLTSQHLSQISMLALPRAEHLSTCTSTPSWV